MFLSAIKLLRAWAPVSVCLDTADAVARQTLRLVWQEATQAVPALFLARRKRQLDAQI
jgi:hypothetical protein